MGFLYRMHTATTTTPSQFNAGHRHDTKAHGAGACDYDRAGLLLALAATADPGR